MVRLAVKPVPELHNQLRIRLLELIVFIRDLPIVIQFEVCVPTLFRFQRFIGFRACSDDYHLPDMAAEAV